MTLLAPHALWLLLLGPVVWWLARRRRFRADVWVPHLAVLEAVLAPRDLTPVVPPWRALLLVAALAATALAVADPRPVAPAPRRVVLLAAGDAAAVEAARALTEAELAGDDVVLVRVRPAGLELVADPPRDTDHRQRHVIDNDALAEDRRIKSEPFVPIRPTHHGDGLTVFRTDQPANRSFHTQSREEVAEDVVAVHSFRTLSIDAHFKLGTRHACQA